jgi:hypothetical protein
MDGNRGADKIEQEEAGQRMRSKGASAHASILKQLFCSIAGWTGEGK